MKQGQSRFSKLHKDQLRTVLTRDALEYPQRGQAPFLTQHYSSLNLAFLIASLSQKKLGSWALAFDWALVFEMGLAETSRPFGLSISS